MEMRKIIDELMLVYMGIKDERSLDLTEKKINAYYDLYEACLEYSKAFRANVGREHNDQSFRMLTDAEAYIDLAHKMNLSRAV